MILHKLLTYLQRDKLILSVVAAILLAAAIHYLALPKIIFKSVHHAATGSQSHIILPQLMPYAALPGRRKGEWGVYNYSFTIQYQPLQQTRFIFHPVGCVDKITVNGSDFPLGKRPTCNMEPGFAVDIEPYLKSGENSLTVQLSNNRTYRGSHPHDTATFGLQIGPKLLNLGNPRLADYLACLLIVNLSIILVLMMKRFTGEIGSGLILSAGLWAYIRHFSITNFMQYTIDMPSHLQYIIFIANRGFWPKPYFGWEYYHPPFYYHLEAIVTWYANWLGSFDSISMMRAFSLLCFMVFAIFSALTLHRVISNRIAYYCALTLFTFYPTGIVFATRLDSHILYYAFYAGCTYFLLRWIQEKRRNDLWFALTMFGFAIGTRSNALVLVPIIGLATLYQWRKNIFNLSHIFSLGMAVSILVIMSGLLGNFGRMAYYHLTENNTMPYIVGNIASIQRSQNITTSLSHLLLLDTQQLFNPPFLTWWHDYTGRQYFWNSVLKTSLFEHFTWRAVHHAKLLVFLLLALIIYTAISACTQTIHKRLEWRMCAASLVIALAMLMINRIMHPYAPSQDFRYIYPSLVSFCAIIGLIVEQYLTGHKYTGAAAGIVMALAFSGCSLLLISAG